MMIETRTELRVDAKPAKPAFIVRGVALVRDAVTGRPKFDFPMCMYPSWAQEEYRKVLTPDEVREFFR
jgi:hypothetical protein